MLLGRCCIVIDKTEDIKNQLQMVDVLARYGYEPNRASFVCCPFHGEKTPSMKVYPKDYHCFGCGAHGDMIDFVRRIFDISFNDALKRIDTDFGLNLFKSKSFEDMRKAHLQRKALKAKRERIKREQEQRQKQYWDVFDEYVRLAKNLEMHKPTNQDEEPHPLFVEALRKMAYQDYLLDCAENLRCTDDRRNNTSYEHCGVASQ